MTMSRSGTSGASWAAIVSRHRDAISGMWARSASSHTRRIASRSPGVGSLRPSSSARHSSQRACCAHPPRSASKR